MQTIWGWIVQDVHHRLNKSQSQPHQRNNPHSKLALFSSSLIGLFLAVFVIVHSNILFYSVVIYQSMSALIALPSDVQLEDP